eukprot:XP_001697138.1 predicted protein [Chlamydomonas reinhardtii]
MATTRAGLLEVTVEFAKGLKDMDFFSKQDPYAVVELGGQKCKTKTHKNGGTSPVWNETFTINVNTETNFNLTVYDEDPGKDDLIGKALVSIAAVQHRLGGHAQPSLCRARAHGTDKLQVPLLRPSGKEKGFVSMTLKFTAAAGGPPAYSQPEQPQQAAYGQAQPPPGYPVQQSTGGNGYPPYPGAPVAGATRDVVEAAPSAAQEQGPGAGTAATAAGAAGAVAVAAAAGLHVGDAPKHSTAPAAAGGAVAPQPQLLAEAVAGDDMASALRGVAQPPLGQPQAPPPYAAPYAYGAAPPEGPPGAPAPYGAPPPAAGYGAPPPGYPPQQPYGYPYSAPGYPAAQPLYGAPPQQQPYCAPPQQQPYGAPPQQQPYGAPPQQQPYGAPPQQQPYGTPPQQQPYGAPPQQQPYGAPPQQQPYGAPPQQQPYGAPPQQPYGAPPPAYGAPVGYAQPPAGHPAYGAPPPGYPPYGPPPGAQGYTPAHYPQGAQAKFGARCLHRIVAGRLYVDAEAKRFEHRDVAELRMHLTCCELEISKAALAREM